MDPTQAKNDELVLEALTQITPNEITPNVTPNVTPNAKMSHNEKMIMLLTQIATNTFMPSITPNISLRRPQKPDHITYDDTCDRDGYLDKNLQIQRYREAGENYDKWLAETYYNGEPRKKDGSPTETEDVYDPCLHHGYTHFDAIDEMRTYTELQKEREARITAEKVNSTPFNASSSSEADKKQESVKEKPQEP